MLLGLEPFPVPSPQLKLQVHGSFNTFDLMELKKSEYL